MHNKPYFIAISGESGVGKSRLTNILKNFFKEKEILILNGDDLHKWERNNEMWNNYTHYNPEANNLELGDLHLIELHNKNFIYRSFYNHETGFFNAPIKIHPKEIILIEGLHSFYTEISRKIINYKIYINANEELTMHWKIIRDSEERGYKYNKILDIINKRKQEKSFIESQIKDADLVITLNSNNKIKNIGDKNEKLEINLSFSNYNDIELINYIKNTI